MKIQLNGEKAEIPEGLSLAGLVEFLRLTPERLAIEYNRQIIKRANWTQQELKDGDQVEIVQFVGGGAGK
ncbi:MAG: sulfur carrier protein ThiS [Acidobacteriota bacterium]